MTIQIYNTRILRESLQKPPERAGLPLHCRLLWAVLAVNTRAAAFARAAAQRARAVARAIGLARELRAPCLEEGEGEGAADDVVDVSVLLGSPQFVKAREMALLRVLSLVLETQLREKMRFSQGSIYTVNVHHSFSYAPPHAALATPTTGRFEVSFTCAPGGDSRRLSDLVLATISAPAC